MSGPDWEGLERKVVIRIRALAAIDRESRKNEVPDEWTNQIAESAEYLAMFCESVELDDDD